MIYKKIIQYLLLISGIIIIYFSYYYFPSQNTGSIKIDSNKIEQKVSNNETLNNKNNTNNIINKSENLSNVFKDTEYINQSKKGQIFITKAKESIIYNDKNNLIYLKEPYSFTRLKKDDSLIEINSKSGLFDKSTKITTYTNKVTIKNKNYIINSDQAKYESEKNIILISGNVVMKDISQKLMHIAYCDIVEINTLNNNIVALMKSQNKKVIAKKF